MTHDIVLLHHVGVIAGDINAAVAQFERLGFRMATQARRTFRVRESDDARDSFSEVPSAIFRGNYLEMLSVPHAKRWLNAPPGVPGTLGHQSGAARYEGLHELYFGTEDLDAVRTRLRRDHIEILEDKDLQEMTGDQCSSRPRSLRFASVRTPEGEIGVSEVLDRPFTEHPNGAQMLTACLVCGEAPELLAARYGRYCGIPVHHSDGTYVINFGSSRLRVVDPPRLRKVVPGYVPPMLPFLAGITVATLDLDLARSALYSKGMEFTDRGERLIVGPTDGCGTAVLFERSVATP